MFNVRPHVNRVEMIISVAKSREGDCFRNEAFFCSPE